ncbi:hypothetical protein B0J17DRAFT_756520 [Rhizoctonia solani]|nr:hypothetical protein B0J17DRAFT_756520 [Rhizoctonia solani]
MRPRIFGLTIDSSFCCYRGIPLDVIIDQAIIPRITSLGFVEREMVRLHNLRSPACPNALLGDSNSDAPDSLEERPDGISATGIVKGAHALNLGDNVDSLAYNTAASNLESGSARQEGSSVVVAPGSLSTTKKLCDPDTIITTPLPTGNNPLSQPLSNSPVPPILAHASGDNPAQSQSSAVHESQSTGPKVASIRTLGLPHMVPFQTLFEPSQQGSNLFNPGQLVAPPPSQLLSTFHQSASIVEIDEEGVSVESDDDHPDKVNEAMCVVPTLDPNTQNNTPPFILQSCKLASEREVDMQNGMEALDHGAAAPVFRRACPEPTGQPVNLPRVLNAGINLRHFATNDIIVSITTVITDSHYGLQWLHGISDRYIILLARINILSENPEVLVDQALVTELENEIQNAATALVPSDDPVLVIWRFTVRECRRIAMHVYLYMVLCGTYTDNPKLMKLVRLFVRLMESVRPGRMPDAFLYIPMMVVGVSSYRKSDRAVIQQRMFGLQEVATPGACGYDALNILLDMWSRSDAESRPAVWSDLRDATYRITGL